MNSKGFHASKFIRQLPPLQLKDPLIFNYRFPSICALLLSPQREPLIFPPICLTKHFPLRQMTQIPIWINSLRRNSFPISLVLHFFSAQTNQVWNFSTPYFIKKMSVSVTFLSKLSFQKGNIPRKVTWPHPWAATRSELSTTEIHKMACQNLKTSLPK